MLFNLSKHRSVLPSILNSHQVYDASKLIYQVVEEAVAPHLEAKPHYQTVVLILDKVGLAVEQLSKAHRKRKYKSARKLKAVGGQDAKPAKATTSQVKLALYNERRNQMRRFRQMVLWYYDSIPEVDPSSEVTPVLTQKQEAGKRIGEMLYRRVDLFEKENYEESTAEFEHLIEEIEADAEAIPAIDLLGVADVYASIKSLHQRFVAERLVHAEEDASGEEQPKIRVATREARHAVRALLKHMHFDLENGDPTFNAVLGQIDEILDKAHAKAARRNTLAKKKAAANQQPATDASGATDANAEADGEPPADGGTGGASGGSSGETSGGDADQGSDADTYQTPVDADPTADANSDQQQVPGEVTTA